MNYSNELWDVLEKYSETKLFRDWNDPQVNKLLTQLQHDLIEIHVKNKPPTYTVTVV